MPDISDYHARAAGIAWIRKEDYAACRAVFEDGDEFFPTWEQWEQSAKKSEQEIKAQGYIVERAYIDPDTFATVSIRRSPHQSPRPQPVCRCLCR